MNPSLSLALILALSTQTANRLAYRPTPIQKKTHHESKRIPAQSSEALALMKRTPLNMIAVNGKNLALKYCSSPTILQERAVITCSIDGQTDESTESVLGAAIEFVRVASTPGRPKVWKKGSAYVALGISSSSKPIIMNDGHVLIKVSSAYSTEYTSSGLLVLDDRMKMLNARELPRVESVNWIKQGDSVIYTTNARVNSMYPTQNNLVYLNSLGEEMDRFPIKGSILGDILQLSEHELVLSSEYQPVPRDPNKRIAQLVFVDLSNKQSKSALIPGSNNIQLASRFSEKNLIASDSIGNIYEFNRVTLESRKIYSSYDALAPSITERLSEVTGSPVVGLTLDSEFSSQLMVNGSIAIVTKTNVTDGHLYLSIIQQDGSIIQRMLFSATTGQTATSVGLIQAQSGEEFIWVGTTGRVYVITHKGELKYTLETPRIDNPEVPVVDALTGQWWAGFGNGTVVYSTTLTPAHVDPLHFQ
ncbi:MAG: hypothetical protein KA715_08895 [Xanthomonadaceae bacterium]|nr:hypothetical protein [Xanthomonadaceae bacterium]